MWAADAVHLVGDEQKVRALLDAAQELIARSGLHRGNRQPPSAPRSREGGQQALTAPGVMAAASEEDGEVEVGELLRSLLLPLVEQQDTGHQNDGWTARIEPSAQDGERGHSLAAAGGVFE